ncbi:MAG: TolC family protein [Bryobacterales bacterium]|nr:TolC family protein [Bryobacterales bacterium]
MRIRLFVLLLPLALRAQTPAAAPLTLDEAVREAMAHNLDLAAARYDISVAEARQITAALRPNPVMTASADHLDLLGTGYNTINNGGPNEYALRTDFVLERGRKREARMNLAAAERGLAQLDFQDAMRRLMFDVSSAFVGIQSARENLALAEDNLRTLNGIVEINTVRVRTGDLAGVELERSQVAALQYETAVKQAGLRLRQAQTALLLLLGRPGGAGLEITGLLRRDLQPLQLEQLHSSARTRRPDLLAVKQAQARSQADLRLQLAQGRIDYTAGVEYRRQQAANAFGNSIGLFFSAPLPVFNRNQGEIARAGRELDQSGARIRALAARVDNEVDAAWQQYSTARSLLESIEETVLAKAKSVRERTDYSYRRGEASFVEFLDAQRAFNDVMQSYNDARAGYARSLYLIDAATAAALP